ncbi:MAG: hypothetical protein HZA54_16295 [Planctomycetes bacterium]|nr:hypothetical protein [Planctomycetota bacterium]
MLILPPQTLPPSKPTRRRHNPRPASGEEGYRTYRTCLRWDFGFTCPFCLLHESDLAGAAGAEGSGVTTVEHHVPRQADRARINDYGNCLYACRYCNRARGLAPRGVEGATLLDPSAQAWGDHFRAEGDRLAPAVGDPDAAYTHRSYDLDDPRKLEMRRWRRELIDERLRFLEAVPALMEALTRSAQRAFEAKDTGAAVDYLNQVRELARHAEGCAGELRRFAAIPRDHDAECRCGVTSEHRLPEGLALQMIGIDLPAPAVGGPTP